ncbi:MAG TPA: ABC transporter ATP-binding protein [Candidatus Limnocylindrales bacterium]|nr:ABC transporter ATP-binding protein [Candidatus Limnocylindrales bacterium]
MNKKLSLPGSSAKHRIWLMIRMLRITWQIRPGALLGFSIAAVLETAAFIVSIYATAKVGGLLATYSQGDATSFIWFWLWIDIAAAAVIGLAFWLMSLFKDLLYFRVVQWATHEFQSALCQLDLTDFYDEQIRNQINKAQSGYTWQISNFAQTTLDLLYALLRFVATAVVVSQITWWLIPLIAVFLVPSLIAEAKLAKVKWFVWDTDGDTRHIFWGLDWILRQAKNQMELRSTQARRYVLEKIDNLNQRFYLKQEQKYKSFSRFMIPAKVLETGGTALGLLVLVRQYLGGALSLDRYFFLSGALLRIGGALNNIFGTLSRMQEQFLFVDNYFAVIDRKPRLIDRPDAVELASQQPPSIEFENVSFSYPGQEAAVFKNLSFTIASGERVAIVGENGAGKSTLIKLLLRFYRPTGGRILIDGHDLQDIAIESWYEQLATLFQDFNQYPFPISENIEVAKPTYAGDQQRLLEAAKLSNVDSFVQNYKFGWETVLDNSFEKGVEPSGGQWQRVALARAFYRHANVLILDEPTAAIDAKAEYDIFNNIFKHYQEKTAIIVSHRFSTVRKADRILVFEHGKVVEAGSHSELIMRRGLYADMFNKQAEGYR